MALRGKGLDSTSRKLINGGKTEPTAGSLYIGRANRLWGKDLKDGYTFKITTEKAYKIN